MKQSKPLWLPLLSGCLIACTVGLQVVGQEPNLDKTSTNKARATGTAATGTLATEAAGEPVLAEPTVEQPPRPAQPPAETKPTTVAKTPVDTRAPADVEPTETTGIRSSSWTETPDQPAVDHELSVEPSTLPLLPDDAPAWVGSLPNLTRDVQHLYVGGHIAESESEAAEGLDKPLVEAVRRYVEEDLLRIAGTGDALAGKLTADYVWKNLIDQRSGYVAKLNTPGQPMYQKWVTVSITPEQRAEIRHWHREAVQRERLAPIGLGVTCMLGCVGLMHLILRRKSSRTAAVG